MNRYLAGVIAGALAVAGVIEVHQYHLRLLVGLIALLAGLTAGLFAGLRAPRPGSALRTGLAAGTLAGALLVGTYFFLSVPLTIFTIVVAAISMAICLGVAVALAGVVSAWTGFPHSAASQSPAKRPSDEWPVARLTVNQRVGEDLPETRSNMRPDTRRAPRLRPSEDWSMPMPEPHLPEPPMRASSSGPLGPLPNLA
ncbi:MAG TPA: hypothetical protein VF812_02070 [Ktedonobacterales bacterium]